MTAAERAKDQIAVRPAIHCGKPCVAGTRIPVQNVLELVREGIPFADIVRDYYPDLTPEDVRAFIQYAMDALAKQENHLSTMMNSSPCPDDDWFFKTMRDAIDANRKREEN